jgi:lysophospholipase L1-like esterase
MVQALARQPLMTRRTRNRRFCCLLAVAAWTTLAVACAPVSSPRLTEGVQPVTRIVFVGDSLIHRAEADYSMIAVVRDELAQRHPSLNLEIVDASVSGDRIADIRDRLDRDVLSLHPAAVLLYFDSDVSDVDDLRMSQVERSVHRAAYERDLRSVLSRSIAAGARMFLSGPTLIGERPRGRNAKDLQLDAYRRINRRVASSLKVTYIDTRRAFFAHRPAGASADLDRGLLTQDGEHLNEHGAIVAGELFVRSLDQWLSSLSPASREKPPQMSGN